MENDQKLFYTTISFDSCIGLIIQKFSSLNVIHMIFPRSFERRFVRFPKHLPLGKKGPMKSLLSVSRTVDQSVIFSFAKTVHKFFLKLYVKTTRQNRAFLKKEISLCRKTTKTPPEQGFCFLLPKLQLTISYKCVFSAFK